MRRLMKSELLMMVILSGFLAAAVLPISSCKKSGGGGSGSDNNTMITNAATQAVGPSGGVVSVTASESAIKGAQVSIPAGALTGDTFITIGEEANPPKVLSTENSVPVVDFGPSGTQFSEPVSITIPYSTAVTDDESNLAVYTYNAIDNYWETVQLTDVDALNHVITAQTDHFSSKKSDVKNDWYLISYLKRNNKKISAYVALKVPFTNIYTNALEEYASGKQTAADLLSASEYRGKVAFKYTVTLMQEKTGLDKEIETISLKYKQVNTEGAYQVNVYKNNGTTPWFSSGTFYGDSTLEDWYTGHPALYNFDHEPVSGKNYYLMIKFELIDEKYFVTTYDISDKNNVTSTFLSAYDMDSDYDGIVNNYDSDSPDTTPPGIPDGLSATAASDTQVNVSWNANTSSDGVAVYEVYRDSESTPFAYITSGTSAADKKRTASTKYCYSVLAKDAAQNPSAKSSQVCATTQATPDTTAPFKPAGLTATAVSQTQIDLAWWVASDNVGVTGYKLYQNDSSSAFASTTATAKSVVKLSAGTNYCYKVSAYDKAGNESTKSDQVCATTQAAPDTTAPTVPAGLTTTAVSQTQINLSWSASTDTGGHVRAYRVYRDGSSSTNQSLTDTSTSDDELAPGTQYCYQVTAYDDANNESAKTSQKCATTWAADAVTYSISGMVTSGGVGLAGVTMTMSGEGSAVATTDANGNYAFTSLANGSYTVTPSMIGYTFTQTSINVTINGADATGKNFTAAAAVTTYSISGTITTSGVGLVGVTVTLTGTGSSTTTTDAIGNYSFSGSQNGSYTLTAAINGYSISPASISVTVNGADVASQNFTATLNSTPTYVISGTVTYNSSGLSGVMMTISGAGTGSATTDLSGNYTITGVANGTYTVTPSKSGYLFSPTSTAASVSGANQTGKNFTASVATYTPNTVPDTGQTGDYTATFGEDSDYTINPPSYTDNGNGTVIDNITGLVWQKQDDATPRTWDAAITYCSSNSAVLPGTGWRLPTDFELVTIVDYGRSYPSIDPIFTGTVSSYYWSSTTFVDYPTGAWGVSFSSGSVDGYYKTDPYYVRCVR